MAKQPSRAKPTLPANKPWQRLGNETVPHYNLFLLYRDLPAEKRSVERVHQNLNADQEYTLNTLRDICADFRWVDRANAYEDFVHEQLERVERYQRIKSLRDMRKRHRENGDALMGKGMGHLRNKTLKTGSIREAVMLVKLAMELQASGHTVDPIDAIVSGDEVEQPAEQIETRRLSIEIFTTNGKPMPADDLRASLIAFYDQKPPTPPS